MSKKSHIALAYDLNYRQGESIYRGVSDYVRDCGLDWEIIPLQYGFETTLIDLAGKGQLKGAIGTFVSDRWIGGLLDSGLKIVNLFNFSEIKSVPSVSVNDAEMGGHAARHLIEQGAQEFIFFGNRGAHFNELRRKGFLQNLEGRTCNTLKPSPLLAEAITEIAEKEKKIGVFCASDRLAREFIIQARQQSLECGRDFLLVSVDNDPSESVFAGIGISSFHLPAYHCGTLAAKLLKQAMASPVEIPSETTFAEAPQLIIRDSSLASKNARLAQSAVSFIEQNYSNPQLDVSKIAATLGVSRRVLELAMKAVGLPGPYRLLRQTRRQHACRLLTESTLPISQVGCRSGYPGAHHFSAWFKQETGEAPKAYRQKRKLPSI